MTWSETKIFLIRYWHTCSSLRSSSLEFLNLEIHTQCGNGRMFSFRSWENVCNALQHARNQKSDARPQWDSVTLSTLRSLFYGRAQRPLMWWCRLFQRGFFSEGNRPFLPNCSKISSLQSLDYFFTGVKGLNGPPCFGHPRRFHAKRGWPRPEQPPGRHIEFLMSLSRK